MPRAKKTEETENREDTKKLDESVGESEDEKIEEVEETEGSTEDLEVKKEKTKRGRKPIKKEAKSKKIPQEEFEKKVIELAQGGLTSEKIGENLRREGIHPKEYNKKISEILGEKNLYINPDLKNISANLERVEKHYGRNKQDKRAMREKDRIFSHLRAIKKYFNEK